MGGNGRRHVMNIKTPDCFVSGQRSDTRPDPRGRASKQPFENGILIRSDEHLCQCIRL